MDCGTPGFPVLHHLPKFAQTHVRGVGDAFSEMTPHSSGNAKLVEEFTPKAPRSRWASAGVWAATSGGAQSMTWGSETSNT